MKILNTKELPLPGVHVIQFGRFRDARGYFTEPFRASDLESLPFLGHAFQVKQSNESFSRKGVVRGLHFQWNPHMGKLIRTVRGHMIDIVLDIRQGSATFGKAVVYDMPASAEGDMSEWIWVPPGFAHGNAFLEDTVIEYFCTGEYSPGNEGCVSPLAADIDWSLACKATLALLRGLLDSGKCVLSDKDRHGLTVRAWATDARAGAACFEYVPQQEGRVLVTGGNGMLARALRKTLPPSTLFPPRELFDVTNLPQMEEFVRGRGVGLVLHAAAFTSPPKVDKNPEKALAVNIRGTANVAELCSRLRLKLLYVSTDYVFSGTEGNYREDHPVLPQNLYAWSKMGGECAVRLCPSHLILRLSFGPSVFPHPKAFVDQWTSRLSVADAAKQIAEVIKRGESRTGVLHLGGPRRSVLQYARSLDGSSKVGALSTKDVSFAVPRDTSLDTSSFRGLFAEGEDVPGADGASSARVCVIGGAGFIGSRLTAELAERGHEVTVVDSMWFGCNLPSDRLKDVIQADFAALPTEFYRDFDVVVLLAGHSSVKMCISDIGDSFRNNVSRCVELLEKLERLGRASSRRIRFLYASSSSVYGNADEKMVDESYQIKAPNNYYDLSKWVIDLYSSLARVEAYGLRFGTVCGASPNLRTDVMLNAMTADALQRAEVRLYVEHIRRPVLGILDLCRAVDAIISSPHDRRGLYNLCSFNGTVREYGEAVGAALAVPVRAFSAGQVETMTNVKLQSKHYDFAISPARFEKTFNFRFQDTVPSVIEELVAALKDGGVLKATRNVRRSAL